MATIIEQLQALLDKDGNAALKVALQKRPELLVDDAFAANILSIYEGSPAATTTETPAATTTAPVATATHTPTVPSAATTTVAPAATTAPVTTPGNSDSILAAIQGLKASMEARFSNVITKDQIPALGAQLSEAAEARALYKANELAMIRETNLHEFGKSLDSKVFEKFVLDAEVEDPVTKVKRNKYPSLTDAYNAMVAEERYTLRVKKDVDTQVNQKLSAATVPGQTTSVALSAAQQVLAKERAKGTAADGDPLKKAIAALEQRDRANGAAQA